MLKSVSITSGGGGSGGGVTSLNSETGSLTLTSAGGTVNITTPTGSTINLESTASSVAFSAITSGTNTIPAAMVVGNGSTLAVSGTGTITATAAPASGITGAALASNVITSSLTSVGTLVNLTVTNPITGSVTGNAATVTTNANLTGPITSVGNATSIASSVALPGNPTSTTQSALTNNTTLATTAYTDAAVATAVAGVNPAVAVQAATTQASDTSGLTYLNGVSGIGASFTGSSNTALTIDGYTFTATGQRLLVKNDTQSANPGAYNGVYYVTQIQSLGFPPILTRALDYDQPSDINNTGAIPVINGTVNSTTTWIQTAQIVTVGTTPLVFVQFSYNPSSIVTTFSAGSTGFTPSSATSGAIILAGTLAVANGGTGQTTASNAITALLPTQTGQNGNYLTTNGTIASWAAAFALTTTGSSGAATYIGGTLNIPQYTGGAGGTNLGLVYAVASGNLIM